MNMCTQYGIDNHDAFDVCYFRLVLTRTLFCASEILQGCTLHVRRLCETASGSLTGLGEGQEAILLVTLDRKMCHTLDQFMDSQKQQIDVSLQKLQALRAKVVDLVWEACAVSTKLLLYPCVL